MGQLDGRVAIITGAGDGLGLGIARAFYKEGAKIATMGRRAEKINALVDEVKAYGGQALAVQGDIGIRENVKKLVDATVKEFGTVDILVNNAMTYNMRSLEDTTDEDIEKVLRSAGYSTFYCMQACFPYMKAQKRGKIINLASKAGLAGVINHAAYSFVKEGLVGLTRTASLEWGKYNIQVNAIAPIAMTPAVDNYLKTLDEQQVKLFYEKYPVGYLGEAEKHVAPSFVFFASSASDYITGRLLCVDGGEGYTR
jgi:NAD(P)-dependent dehydrogenase (short-subunit alcohol dehydrogenase family)